MKRTSKALIAGAAMAGLMTGAVARVHATQPTTTKGTSMRPGRVMPSGTSGTGAAIAHTATTISVWLSAPSAVRRC